MSTTTERLLKLVAEQVSADADSVTPESTFTDLNIDSIDQIEIVMSIEEEFDIDISDGDMNQFTETWKTVGDVIAYVERRVSEK